MRSGYLNRAVWAPAARGGEEGAEERARPSINGLVYDMAGLPLPRARVIATTYQLAGNIPTTAAYTESDAAGRFKLELPRARITSPARRTGMARR